MKVIFRVFMWQLKEEGHSVALFNWRLFLLCVLLQGLCVLESSKGSDFSRQDIFTNIYENKIWASAESLSGGGSDIATTKTTRFLLPAIVELLGINVLVDIGCGDFNWFKTLSLRIKQYIGVDIVRGVIDKNIELYSNDERTFLCLDAASEPLPKGDLVLCKDVLQHLSHADAQKVINRVKQSGAKYFLTTVYLGTEINKDCPTGGSEPINLFKEPFNFPEPILLFREMFGHESMRQKKQCLCLWPVDQLPVFYE